MKFGLKRKAKKGEEPKILNSYYDILRSPIVTEKTTLQGEQNKVVFAVSQDATKGEIKAAVEAIFNVKVAKVNTLVRKGKVRRFRGVEGRRADIHKAIVTLAEGQSLDLAASTR